MLVPGLVWGIIFDFCLENLFDVLFAITKKNIRVYNLKFTDKVDEEVSF